ncbi:MFS general substrate transporter [Gymnopus androsaceus JB14]|uniref:MFS general substrate transporter n=1 Tax=Gymnopus androsaceus JB14 TaxID=1447944 RepID=A0A6A4I9Y3_9AGAR|nr:MFS general substrate transporter [Gymnopus androsaceus JB14]
MSDLPEYLTSYVVQSNDIIPIDVVFEGPLAELGEPKKSIVHSVIKVDSDSEKVPVTAIEETYPDRWTTGMARRDWLFSILGHRLVVHYKDFVVISSGWTLTWGVREDYYHSTMFPDTSLSVLSITVGLASFIMCASSYLFGGLGDRFGYKVKVIAISCCLGYLSLLASAFATKVYQLFLFQGVLLGLSQGMGLPLYYSICSQWFLKKRGLATGIAVSGNGIGGAIETLIARRLITELGYKNTLIAFSSVHAFIWVVAWFLLKERLPPGTNPETKKRWLPKKITGTFYSVALSMFFGVFGSFTPYYLITTYTEQVVPSVKFGSLLATVPLIVMSFCLGIGRITAGQLADAFGPTNMFFCSFFIGGILQMVFWTFARSYAAIIAFSALNGLIGLATITGFMILANAPGQFAGLVIGATILSSSGNNWTAVSLYSGSMQVMGALCILYARFHKDRRLFIKV